MKEPSAKIAVLQADGSLPNNEIQFLIEPARELNTQMPPSSLPQATPETHPSSTPALRASRALRPFFNVPASSGPLSAVRLSG